MNGADGTPLSMDEEAAVLATLESQSFTTIMPLAVNVDFNDLLLEHGETGAFELIGKLKDLLR
jgi:hypothetical protein